MVKPLPNAVEAHVPLVIVKVKPELPFRVQMPAAANLPAGSVDGFTIRFVMDVSVAAYMVPLDT